MNAKECAEWKRYRKRQKLRRDAENRDVYYYFTDLAKNGGNHKRGECYNVAACFSGIYWG